MKHFSPSHTIRQRTNNALIIEVPCVPYSIVAKLYPGGSRSDPPHLYGLTHVVEHLVGHSATAGAWQQHEDTLQRHGILLEAYTTKDYTVLCAIQPHESTDVARTLLENLPFTIDAPRVRSELLAIHEEREDENRDIDKTMAHAVSEALWPHATLAHTIIGNRDTLECIDEHAVRTHIERYFTPTSGRQLVLGVGVSKIQGTPHTADTDAAPCQNLPEQLNNPTPFSLNTSLSLGDRVRVGIYFRTVPATALQDRIALGLFADHMAGFWTSLLNRELRMETGFSYWVTAELAYYRDTGSIGFEFTCAISHAMDALKRAMALIDTSVREGVSAERFRALTQARRAELIRESTDRFFLKGWYIEELAYATIPTTLDSYLSQLDVLDYEPYIATVRRCITKSQRAVVVLGDVPDATVAQWEYVTDE